MTQQSRVARFRICSPAKFETTPCSRPAEKPKTMTEDQPAKSHVQQRGYDTENVSHSPGLNGCTQAAIGFGLFSVVLLCIAAAGVYWLVQNARGIAANLVTPAIQNIVSQMEIPAEQKKQISTRINELGRDFKNQKIGVNELENILKGVANSPISGAAATIWFTDQYISKSGMTDFEKQDATLTAKRFAKGLLDKSISNKEANEVMEMLSEETTDGQTSFKDTITDKELRLIILKMKNAADSGGVPPDVPDINFADEFDQVVAAVLMGKAKTASPTASAASGEPATTRDDDGTASADPQAAQ